MQVMNNDEGSIKYQIADDEALVEDQTMSVHQNEVLVDVPNQSAQATYQTEMVEFVEIGLQSDSGVAIGKNSRRC